MNCQCCEKYLDEQVAILFNEFGKVNKPKVYCHECFEHVIITEFKTLGDTCNKCGSPVELKTDDLEVDVEEGILWYVCKQKLDSEDWDEFEDHDSVGEYIIQSEVE